MNIVKRILNTTVQQPVHNYLRKYSQHYSMTGLRVALIQMLVGKNRDENLKKAEDKIFEATASGASLVALPECFNSPYGTQHFPVNAEKIPDGPTCEMLSRAAKQNGIYLIGGTHPEVDDGKYYNTCTVWNPKGEMIAKYRKIHLFDIDIPGKITFRESDILSPGNSLATFDIDDIKIGIGICYDLRFGELAKLYRKLGCKVLVYPAAFNMTTGPMHWQLLQRAVANDNQVYICCISPATGTEGYVAWGHSQITSPWGSVLAEAEHEEYLVTHTLDMAEVDAIREQIPIFPQRRTDIYDTIARV